MSFPVDARRPVAVRCAHKIGRNRVSGEGVPAVEPIRAILEDIRDRSRLLAMRHPNVYAYKIDLVPSLCRDWVLVVFEVDSGLVRTMRYARNECPQQAFEYYEIPTTQGTYLAVDVLGFVNAPHFEAYRGPIRFRDGFLA
jgi:hypothetical protein